MNLLLPLTIFIVQWSIDSKDPQNQFNIMLVFLGVHVLLLLLALVAAARILIRRDSTPVTYEEQFSNGNMITQTCWRYDLGCLFELLLYKIAMPAGVSVFMGRKYGLFFPLLIQCWSNPKAVYSNELVQIYILGREPVGTLQRPWKQNNVVPDWLSKMWAESEEEVSKKAAAEGTKTAVATKKGKRK
eukprot:gene11920-8201_t